MSPSRQRAGGLSALFAALTFVIGFAMAATLLSSYTMGDPTPAESAAFFSENETALSAWYIVILILFGIALLPLVTALHERIRAAAPGIADVALALGVIWAGLVIAAGMIGTLSVGVIADLDAADPADAVPVWSAVNAVQNGLGGGNEIVGGAWVLLVSVTAGRSGSLPRGVNLLGMTAGTAGIVTILPILEEVGAIFGLGMIAWFTWVGFLLLGSVRSRARAAAAPSG